MSLQHLPNATIKLITSSQVITSVTSVVKELMENAIDAGAKNINVKIEDNGLGKIEVKDDGCGVQKSDMINVCLPSYTSKITDFSDLESLQSYGFRGEALSALCQVSEVTITTRTSNDELATAYTMGKHGDVKESKLSHHGVGTQIIATNLFKNLPVRKQYLNSGRRATDEVKRMESVVKALAVIHPCLRVTLTHNKCTLWQKTAVVSLRLSLMQVIGHAISSKLEELNAEEKEICVSLIIPKKDCTEVIAQSSSESIMVFVNKRPVKYKKLEQLMMKYINDHFDGQIPARKYPHCLASIDVAPSQLDVNLEPNKTRVLFKNEEEVLACIEKLLSMYYAPSPAVANSPVKVVENAEPRKHKLVKGNCEIAQTCKKAKLYNSDVTEMADDLEIDTVQALSKGHSNNKQVEIVKDDDGLGFDVCDTEEQNQKEINDWNDSLFHIVDTDLTPLGESTKNRSYMNYDTSSKTFADSKLAINEQPNRDEEFREASASNSLPSSNDQEPCITEEMWMEIDKAAGWTDAQLAIISSDTSIVHSSKHNNESHNKSKSYMPEARTNRQTFTTGIRHRDKVSARPISSNFEECVPNDDESELIKEQNTGSCLKQGSLSRFVLPDRERTWDKVDDCPPSLLDCVVEEAEVEKPATVCKEHWSTGRVRAANGKLVQGSCVLLPNTSALGAGSVSAQMNQSVSSQMGQKENSAFTKFSREIRPQILQENPGIAFTKVAALMVNRWRCLKHEEKERYEKMARENDEERKKQCYTPTVAAPLDPKQKKERIEKFQKLLNNSIEACPQEETPKTVKKRTRRPGQKRCHVEISLNDLAEKVFRESVHETAQEFALVGRLQSGIWLYRQGNEIGVVRHWGLQETVLCDQLMKDHTVPLMRLDNEILLSEKLMGSEHWKLLLSLEKSYNGLSQHVTITSPFVSKNGFRIEVNGGGDEVSCALTGIPSVSRFYGVAELKETLLLLEKYGPEACLEKCRPLKLRYYIEAEAVRMGRESSPLDQGSMDELLKYWHTTLACERDGYHCLHGKLIFMPIHKIGGTTSDAEDMW